VLWRCFGEYPLVDAYRISCSSFLGYIFALHQHPMQHNSSTRIAVVTYLIGIITANILASIYGPVATPYIAFTLIGLDLSLRDFLQLRLQPMHLLGLIGIGGMLSYIAVPEAGIIAVASATAFIVASMIDWLVFSMLKRCAWLVRANLSNVAGAILDSAVFVTVAFGFLWEAVLLQFAAKVAGGFLWSLVLTRLVR
jgi:uncharacterized PurR-regulated membrane protein YhhQ (DUF165 family)